MPLYNLQTSNLGFNMSSRPNILLIMTDQQRYDALGYMHTGESCTPCLDRLAASGTIFRHAYSSSTACVPARVSLLTGMLPNRTPRVPKTYALQEGFWTVARAFRDEGYETALFGKLHAEPMRADHGFQQSLLVEHLPAGYGKNAFDDYRLWVESTGRDDVRFIHPATPKLFPYPEEMHPTPWITEHFIDFMKTRSDDKPYFAMVSFAHPHTPYDPPARYSAMFPPEAEAPPKTDFSVNQTLPLPFLKAANDNNPSGYFVPMRTHEMPPNHVAAVKASIRALNRQIDDSIALLLQEVDLNNTVIFYLSDHGDYGGERGLLSKIPWIPFDDLARVPFFMAGANVPRGRTVDLPVQTFDFVPTALGMANITFPYAGYDSVDLRTYFTNEGERLANRPIISETQMGFPMVLRGQIKDIWHNHTDTHLLYDLANDPEERFNVANNPKYRELMAENAALLLEVLRCDIFPVAFSTSAPTAPK